MELRIWKDPTRASVFLYVKIAGQTEDGAAIYLKPDGTGEKVPLGAEAPAYASIPDPVWDELVRFAGREAPAPADFKALSEALDDARRTRDRTLGMVERIVDADIAREAKL